MPKLRWDCERQGCFNRVKRPKIELFDDCFQGSNAFTDLDSIIERHGRFLILEWKGKNDVPIGQSIMFKKMTLDSRFVVVVVRSDAETMVVEAIQVVEGGETGEWEPCDIESLKQRMRRWEHNGQC